MSNRERAATKAVPFYVFSGGRYWTRTSDPCRVKRRKGCGRFSLVDVSQRISDFVAERFSSFVGVVLDRCWTAERSAGRFPGVRLLWTLQQCRLRKTLKSSSTRRCRNYLSNSAIVCSALPPSISPAWLQWCSSQSSGCHIVTARGGNWRAMSRTAFRCPMRQPSDVRTN